MSHEVPSGAPVPGAPEPTNGPNIRKRTSKRLLILVLFAFGMLGFAFANIPLFRVFCQHFGLYVAPNEKLAASSAPVDQSRTFSMLFSAVSSTGVEVRFHPDQPIQVIHPGQRVENKYDFYNPTDHVVKFRAIHDIYPASAATHLALMQCFCFSNQTMQPHEHKSLPVIYQLNPGIRQGVNSVSMNYTLFPEK